MKRLLAIFILGYSAWANAMSWKDLWLRPDQQGVRLLQQGKAEQAATTFEDQQWQGAAYYRAGDYQQASQRFKQQDTADAHYNRGNALALQGDYQAALQAYEVALKLEPQHADAKYNYQIIKQLLQQQAASQNNQSDSQKQQQGAKQQPQSNSKPQQTSSEKQAQQQDSKQSSLDNDQSKQADNKQQQSKGQNTTQQNDEPKWDKDKRDATKSNAKNNAAKDNEPSTVDTVKKQTEKIDKQMTPSEIQQANEQWLRQIPDDPGGLLRQKFLRDYERMQH